MTEFDSTESTNKHIKNVIRLGEKFIEIFRAQLVKHDASKLIEPEKALFDEITPLLEKESYGSPGYDATMTKKANALQHHYANNSHHPQHYKTGVDGMNLFDIIEMLVDWKAATERTKDGDIKKSLKVSKDRFDLSPQLVSIFANTIDKMNW